MNKVISNKVYDSIQPYKSIKYTTGKVLYANSYSGISPVTMPNDIKALLDSDVGLNGTNILVQLENKFKHFRNGPWYVDCRDGVIYIHNRKFAEEPAHTYVYQNENGEVLKVQFQTNYVQKSTKVILHETIDPDTKTLEIDQSTIKEPDESKFTLTPIEGNGWGVYDPNGKSISVHNDANGPSPSRSVYQVRQDILQDNLAGSEMQQKAAVEKQRNISVWAGDPESDRKRAESEFYANLDSRDEIRKFVNDETKFPEEKRRQLNKVIESLKSDPTNYEANLKKVTDGFYVTFEGQDSLEYTAHEWVDPKDYANMSWEQSVNPAFGVNEQRIQGFNNLNNTPGIIVTDYEMNGQRIQGNRIPEGQVATKARIVHVTKKPMRVPLFKLYQNFYSRYGGIEKYAWASNANMNGGLKSREKQIIGTMTVVGRPLLESSMVITILNVGKRWSGPWYIKKCTHKMDAGTGYICELELVRNGAVGGVVNSKASISTENILHVNAQNNGKTSYGKDKKVIVDINKLMSTYTTTELIYFLDKYLGKYIKEDGTIDWESVPKSALYGFSNEAIANKIAFNEVNADDPITIAGGTVVTPGGEINSQGELKYMSAPNVLRAPEDVVQKYMNEFDVSRIAKPIAEAAAKVKRSGLQWSPK